ncbi:MAG: hypothetical protein MJ066_03970 [Clostridia bacterium]|nr:hypothetical protein [Clostridia bacterium]
MYFAVNNWFSKLLYDVYKIPKSYSILISLFVPLIIFTGSIIAVNQSEKHENFFAVALVMYSISLVFSFLLIFLYNANIVLSIVLEIAYLIIANGARSMFGSIFVFKMRTVLDSGKTGLITNAVASFAAGIAPTIIGFIFDNFGWAKSYLVLFIMDVILVLMILFTILNEKRKSKTNVRQIKLD